MFVVGFYVVVVFECDVEVVVVELFGFFYCVVGGGVDWCVGWCG